MRTTSYLFIFSLLFTVTSWAADTFEIILPDQPSVPPAAEQESEVQSVYESAFSSYRSIKKTSEDDAVDQADAWRLSQEKPDNFDVESLSYSAAKAHPRAAKAPSPKRAAAGNRAPASADSRVDEIPLPEGIELQSEIERTTAPAAENEVASSPISAKDRKAMILKTISNNYGELKSCYHEGLRKKSDMKGKVVMGWSMDTQGRVSGAEVQTSQLNNKQVEKCMVERLSNWRFPRQAKLQGSKDRMTYTFQFVPEHD